MRGRLGKGVHPEAPGREDLPLDTRLPRPVRRECFPGTTSWIWSQARASSGERRMMQSWGDHMDGLKNGAEVVLLHGRSA